MQPRSGGRPSALESVLRSELARRRIEARRAEQRVERELSRTVHDLKAPLSALKGYVDMMLRGIAGPMPPTANRYLTRIREVVDRERQLIDDRLRPRSHPAPPPMTDLARALAAAVDRSGPALRARRLQLSLELPPRGCPVPASQGLVDLLARRLVRHLLQTAAPGTSACLFLRDDLGRRYLELSPGAASGTSAGADLRIALAAAARLGAHPTFGPVLRIELPHET
ncbi:MAG TPA: histidine kinase dimerization/phospho-acceptor domain-containing protein [Myxococcaceae bacterium]|nr:histidine kinase dimerization/phospho-acceptor domain-containing protein [Myxococcaceae bacterium]